MNRRALLLAAAAAPIVAGCAAPLGFNPPPSGLSGMLSGLQRHMGTSLDQTTAGAGALTALAQNKLSPADFARLNTSLPGLPDLATKGAGLLGVSPSSLNSLAAVNSAMSKLNVSPAQMNAMASYMGNFLNGSNASSAANMLGGILR
jgi:hypothetical protein